MEPKAPFAHCDTCPLRDQPFVPPYYPPSPKVVAIGEAPGAEEVRAGRPFVGQSGKLFSSCVASAGFEYETDIAATNAVLCRPEGNRTPSETELAACKDRLEAELVPYLQKPWITLGKTAKFALLGWDAPRGQWQGNIMPTWHPAYVLRKPSAFGDLQRDVFEALGANKSSITNGLQVHIVLAESLEEVKDFIEPWLMVTAREDVWGAFDIESDNLQWYDTYERPADDILYLQITFNGIDALVVPRRLLLGKAAIEYFNSITHKFKWYAHNGEFDAVFLYNQLGIDFNVDFDTMLAHYILNENGVHGLKALALEFFGIPDWETDLKTYLINRNDRYSKVPEDVMVPYAATDVVVTWRLGQLFTEMLVKEGLYTWPFKGVIMRAHNLAMEIKYVGQLIDIPHLQTWKGIAEREMAEHLEKMELIAGHSLNPNSWMQVGKVIWDERRLPPNKAAKHYREKPRSTDSEALEHLHSYDPNNHIKIRDGDPFVDELLEYRHVAKMVSSYMDNLLERRDAYDRVHPDVLLTGTEIGRTSMRNPAMQTIPRPSDRWGRAIRSSIIAPYEHVLIVADHSQAELRMLGALSGDPFLIEAYNAGRDIHTEVAIAMFGPDFTKEQRVMVKMFNFAYAYGGNEYSFAQDAGLPLEMAKQFVRQYDKQMAVAKQWKYQTYLDLVANGYVQTRFGRRRRFPLITDANVRDAKKACVHFLVASSASDVTLLAATQLVEEGHRVVLTVHDSILVEETFDKAEQTAQHMVEVMESVASFWFPEVKWKAEIERNKEGKMGVRWTEPPEFSSNEQLSIVSSVQGLAPSKSS